MRRRTLLAGAAMCVAGAAIAQSRSAIRIASLSITPASAALFRRDTLPVLARAGWREGENLTFDGFDAGGQPELLAEAARRLAAWRPDVAIAVSNLAAHPIRTAAPSLPIVMGFAGNDPVADGLVRSISRPGVPVTGVIMLADELNLKRLDFVREIVPRARRVGYLVGVHLSSTRIEAVAAASTRIGLELIVTSARPTEQDSVDLSTAFDVLSAGGAEAVVVASSPVLSNAARELARIATAARLPTITEWRRMVEAGCLASYGPNEADLRSLTGEFIVRILNGERAEEMPMQSPAKFELAVNVTTARAIGLELAPSFLARVDEMIE